MAVSPYLHFESCGSGPAVICIHGWGASVFSWRNIVEPLAKHHRVITVDLKGFGDSPKPDDGAYSVFDQSEHVSNLIEYLALDSFVLAGHSYGGAVSLALAMSLKKAGSTALRGLILIGAASYPQELPPAMKLMKTPVLAHIGFSLLTPEYQVRMMLNQLVFDQKVITDEMIAGYVRSMKSPESRRALTETLRQIKPPNIDEICARYPEITVPSLLIWGREDRIVPLFIAEKLVKALPNARLTIFDQCGHIPHEEYPTATSTAMSEFLAEIV